METTQTPPPQTAETKKNKRGCQDCGHALSMHGPKGMPGYCRKWHRDLLGSCGCQSYVAPAVSVSK